MASVKMAWIRKALDLETEIAVKQDDFAYSSGMIFVHEGKPSDRSRSRGRLDFHFTGTFRDSHENGAAIEIKFLSALGKTKDAVGAEAGEGLIGKSELGS